MWARYTGAGIPFLGSTWADWNLTEVEVGRWTVLKVCAGSTIERRAICVQVCRQGKVVEETCALNKPPLPRSPGQIIRLDVCVDNVPSAATTATA